MILTINPWNSVQRIWLYNDQAALTGHINNVSRHKVTCLDPLNSTMIAPYYLGHFGLIFFQRFNGTFCITLLQVQSSATFTRWLGGIPDRMLDLWSKGPVASFFKWLLLWWGTVKGQVNHPSRYITHQQAQLRLPFLGVANSSTGLLGCG